MTEPVTAAAALVRLARRRRAYLRAAGLAAGAAAAGIAVLPMLMLGGLPDSAGLARAALDIPPAFLAAYLEAAHAAPCSVSWSVLAGAGKAASDHGRIGGAPAEVSPAGDVTPRLAGPLLPGPDTDGGRWDGDATADRRVGPLQASPSAWGAGGRDGSGDGIADPHNLRDALARFAHAWCALPDPTAGLEALDPPEGFLEAMRSWSQVYDRFALGAGSDVLAAGSYTLPVPAGTVTAAEILRPHWDGSPAADLPVPAGTPLLAVTTGSVDTVERDCGDPQRCPCGNGLTLRGTDGFGYRYCHAASVLREPGDAVEAGASVGTSGWTGRVRPLSPEGAHLHFEIQGPEAPVCPQPVLQAWALGIPLPPGLAPRSGCPG